MLPAKVTLITKKLLFPFIKMDFFIKKKKGQGDELLSFDIPSPGTFTLSAKVYFKDRETCDLHSGDIIVPPVALLPPPPPLHVKSLKGHLALIEGEDNYLEIKFYQDGLDKLKNEKAYRVPIYSGLRSQLIFEPRYTKETIKRIIKISSVLEQCAYIYKVDPNIPKSQLLALTQEIERLDYVEYCALLSKLVYPPPLDNSEEPGCASSSPASNTEVIDDITHNQHEGDPPQPFSNTPNFTPMQDYLDPGQGMNVRAAWARNVSGQMIGVHVSDFGVEDRHEDLIGSIRVFTNRPREREHGTATVGAIRANNNNFGVTGIAFNCAANFYEVQESDIDLIIANFRPGDVVAINIEMTYGGGPPRFPAVHSPAWWNRINILVRSGAVVVFAAGNGGNNLLQSSRFNNHGDSGGIMVGASSSQNGRRLSFSNFNLYLSANSWGENVTTTGYGELFNQPPFPLRTYTDNYNGTSSATPLVTGAMALIQSYARTTYGVVLNARDMWLVIERSGSRDAEGQGIGVRPNVNEALNEVDVLLGGTPPPPPPPPPPQYPAWQLGASYVVGDRVSYDGLNYRCIQTHIAHAITWRPPLAPTLWRRI